MNAKIEGSWIPEVTERDAFNPVSGHYTIPDDFTSIYVGGEAPNADYIQVWGPRQTEIAELICKAVNAALLSTQSDRKGDT